jgi:uncharacterized membrane protein HdeD (DUF308 family)
MLELGGRLFLGANARGALMTMPDQAIISDDARSPLKLAGFLAIALGFLSLVTPFVAGLVVTFLLGANFLIGGFLEAFAALKAERWRGTIGLMMLAVISIIAGLVIFAHPVLGLTTLTLVAIAALIAAGLAKIYWATQVRSGAGFLVVSGVLSILVAGMIFTNFPLSAAWALGVLVGVNLIVEGASLLAFVKAAE